MMGCDIHIVLERKNAAFGWVGIDSFKGHETRSGLALPLARSRDYRRFAALAGVRGDGPEPLGVPDDASPLSKMLINDWAEGGHSHSWLPAKEAAELFAARRWPNESPIDPESHEAKYPWGHYFGIEADDVENYRIIFWFDN